MLRMNCHDCLHPHHDKDYTCLLTFPVIELEREVLQIWKVDQWGSLKVDLLRGGRALRTPSPGWPSSSREATCAC